MSPQEQEAVEAFPRDVVEPSMTKVVIVDFWAVWCGPYKALGPVLEKVSAEYADKGVVVATVTTGKHQITAPQCPVKSMPTFHSLVPASCRPTLTQARYKNGNI